LYLRAELSPRVTIYKGRRKRYLIITSFAVVVISIALYNAAQSNPYKNSRTWNFDSYQGKGMPDGFLPLETGSKENGTWVVKPDGSAPSKPYVLAKLSNNETEPNYHILIQTGGAYSNFQTSVKFKIISGEKEQAAGLIIRFQDSNQYFVLLADAKKHRFSLCRAQIEGLVCTQDRNYNITTGQWYTITAQVATSGIVGYLDNNSLLQRYDSHYMTGQIGLWTKGDSVVYFDDLKIDY
jgi:hypothetical protein